MNLAEIQIRDPFVLPLKSNGIYYLYGSTDKNIWTGPGTGFDCYRSRDLQAWEGPFAAFRPEPDFWATTQFWAPEVYWFNGRFFMFATFKADGRYRGTQILVSDHPEGPFRPWSEGPVTPANWECLDGTLHIDEEGNPWIVFCHEWTQVHNGAIYAMRLSADLKRAGGRAVFLFNASEAAWVNRLAGLEGWEKPRFPIYVTDGPFLHRTKDGPLLMLWSSFGAQGYAMGMARSASGTVTGPWTQESASLWVEDGGHGMIFRSFDERLFLVFHQPNVTPNERAVFCELWEREGSVSLKPTR